MTKHRPLFVISASILAVAAFAASTGLAPAERQGVFAVLRIGQPVQVKESAGGYEIGSLEKFDGPLGYTVIEIGPDYIVCRDIANVTELRIPIYAIKSVTTTRLGR